MPIKYIFTHIRLWARFVFIFTSPVPSIIWSMLPCKNRVENSTKNEFGVRDVICGRDKLLLNAGGITATF